MASLYESFNDAYNHLPIKLYKHNLKGKSIWAPLHWHRSVEIFIAFEGHIIVNVSSANFDFSKEDWLIINSSELHSSRYINLSDHFRGISILISLPFIETWLGKSKFFYNPHDAKVTSQVKQIAEAMYQADETSSQYSLYLMNKLYELLLVISKNCTKDDGNHIKPFHKDLTIANEFLDYIELNYHQSLSLQEIAEHFTYSPSYFSRYFKEIIGVNYNSYLNFVRVHHASQQLLETKITLTDCAINNGFPNIKSFITTFKKLYGCTPKQYIKR